MSRGKSASVPLQMSANHAVACGKEKLEISISQRLERLKKKWSRNVKQPRTLASLDSTCFINKRQIFSPQTTLWKLFSWLEHQSSLSALRFWKYTL